MASTIDLRSEIIGVVPSSGIRAHAIIKASFDASKVSGGLVNGNTYKFLTIPPKFVLTRAMIRVRTVDAGGGTSTLTDGTIVPLAAQVMTALGMFYGTTNVPKYYLDGGYLAGLIATANLTLAVFDVIAEGFSLDE